MTDVMRSIRPGAALLRAVVCGAALAACGGAGADPEVPPVVSITAATGSSTVASGRTVQLAASLTNSRGRRETGATFTWSSANSAVASVSADGLVTGTVAGAAVISATSAGTTGTITVTVTPGTPAKLAVATQPAGASSGTALTTQPVVEVRDLADNVVTGSTAAVEVVLLGAGGLTGTTLVRATDGVARFTDLVLSGPLGSRSLQFVSTGLSPATSGAFALRAGAATTLAVATAPTTLRSGLAAGAPLVLQLRDRDGNDVALAGRRVVATVSGGSGATAISNASATTNADGQAAFTALTVSGIAGARVLTFTADSIAASATARIDLAGGRPTRLLLDRDLPLLADQGVPVSPAPLVRLVDSVGNTALEADVAVRAAVVSGPATLSNDVAVTDRTGRATFTGLTVQGASGIVTVRFTATGLPAVTSRAVTVAPPDTNAQPAFITTSVTSADTTERVLVLGALTASATPYLQARNAANAPMAPTGVRWISRDPSRATVSADGRITGVAEGRTFIVAQASRAPGVADSLLVFVPKNSTGPILRVQLPRYRITTDTFSIIVQVESRDGRALSAADVQVSWPGSASRPFSPFTVTGITPMRPGVVASVVDLQENVAISWASTTPVSGVVTLVRLQCRVNQRGVANQLVLTMRQLIAGDLTDLTALVSIFNPVVIIP